MTKGSEKSPWKEGKVSIGKELRSYKSKMWICPKCGESFFRQAKVCAECSLIKSKNEKK